MKFHVVGKVPPTGCADITARPSASITISYLTSTVTCEPELAGKHTKPVPVGLVPIAHPARMSVVLSIDNCPELIVPKLASVKVPDNVCRAPSEVFPFQIVVCPDDELPVARLICALFVEEREVA